MSDKMLRHAKVANYLVGQAFRGYDAVIEHNDSKRERAHRGLRIAGHLIIISSCDLIDDAYNKFRFAKRLSLREAREAFQEVRAALPGIQAGIETLIREDISKSDKSRLLKNTIERMQTSIPKLVDLSESVQFSRDNKKYFALADQTLYNNIQAIFSALKRTKLIDRLKNSGVGDYARIGSQLEKDLKRLEMSFKKTDPSFDDFESSEIVVRVAGENRIPQIISA